MSVKCLVASGVSNFVVYMTWFDVPFIFLLIIGSSNIGIHLLLDIPSNSIDLQRIQRSF